MLSTQMRLAASLGFTATPSFLIAGAGVLGYPGPKALGRILDAVRRCDRIAC
jgi:protein-disulfide isomerase